MADEKKTDSTFDPAGIVEKAFLLGLGVLETTKDKTSELANDLIEKGRVSNSDAKKVADKINTIAAEQQEAMRKTVATETEKAIKANGGVTRQDFDNLQTEIAELKEMLRTQAGGTKPAAPADPAE
jgi:polyhydroxyalkanoate synthesis regulator phasin